MFFLLNLWFFCVCKNSLYFFNPKTFASSVVQPYFEIIGSFMFVPLILHLSMFCPEGGSCMLTQVNLTFFLVWSLSPTSRAMAVCQSSVSGRCSTYQITWDLKFSQSQFPWTRKSLLYQIQRSWENMKIRVRFNNTCFN